MQISTENLPKGQLKITIELTTDELKPHLERAAFLISKESKFDGFRPGKAPYDVVVKNVGQEKVLQEAIEPAVQKTFVKAINDKKIITVGSPQIDIIKMAPNNPFIYTATVSLLPKVEMGDYKNIKIKEKEVNVSDDELDKALKNLAKMRHTEALVDRAIKKDDKVEINFKSFLEKIPVEGGAQEKFPLVVGENTFIPGFEDQLIGMKAGQEKKFQLRFPKEYHDKNLSDKLVDFEIIVNAVYEVKLPQLNDDFAKGIGNFKNIEELKTQLKDNLKHEAKHKEERRVEEEMIQSLIKIAKFDDIPELLINNELQKMIAELEQNIKNQGMNFEDYLNHIKKKRDDLMIDFAPQAIERIKSALIVRQVAQDQKIEVTDNDIDEEIKRLETAYAGNEELKKQIQSPHYKDYLKNMLASKKTLDSLKKQIVK
ncbi:trigger factor [Patescibacteria group bacterium]|nr:trigger factor [Patescibacteria group bacterium]